MPQPHVKHCRFCGLIIDMRKRKDAIYCCPNHRVYAYRDRRDLARETVSWIQRDPIERFMAAKTEPFRHQAELEAILERQHQPPGPRSAPFDFFDATDRE